MKKWEYCEVLWESTAITANFYSIQGMGRKSLDDVSQWGNFMAQMGAEGWELVNIITTPDGSQYYYYFKREIN